MHEDIKQDFEMAQVKHLLFKSKLRSALYGSGTAEAPIRDAQLCALGVWIRERALVVYGHLPESRELDKVHQQIHQVANRLLDLHQQGKSEQAIAGLASIQVYVDEITRLLRTMEQKLRTSNPLQNR
ncbi:CZB domain-containing protein [Hymenobacter sp. HD11105]